MGRGLGQGFLHLSPGSRVLPPMTRWAPPFAAGFLAAGYVHYLAVRDLGGNPAFVVVWLVLFLAAGAVAMKHTLDQIQS